MNTFFTFGSFLQFTQQLHVILMICFQIRARCRKQTLPVLADTLRHLLVTRRVAKIGGLVRQHHERSPRIPGLSSSPPPQPGSIRWLLVWHDPPLMHRQGAEITSAKAAPVAHQTELYLCNRRNAARRIVHRMPSPAVWKRVDIIHLLPRQRFCRWILHDIDRAIRLHETFSGKWIRHFLY